MVQLIESGSPLRIEGQRDHAAIGISPLPTFHRQQVVDVHVCPDLRFGDVVAPCKSQQRDEVLGKWPRSALCTFAMTRLRLRGPGKQGWIGFPRPLLYQRINGTFYEIDCTLSLWLVHRSIEPGGSLRGGRFTRRSQSSPPVPVDRLHDRLPSCPFL